MTDLLLVILSGVLAVVSLGALAGWAVTLVHITRSLLPQAQAYQALDKINNTMDDRIRAVLANFDKRTAARAQPEATKAVDELAAVRARAASMGLSIGADGSVNENRPIKPAPEPNMPAELLNLPIEE